jgi:hypothetical protein
MAAVVVVNSKCLKKYDAGHQVDSKNVKIMFLVKKSQKT